MSIVRGDSKMSGTFTSTSSSIQWSQTCRLFEFVEILLATENFNESLVIGSGEFGKVYKGNVIVGSTNVVAAIKRLDSLSSQGATEFWAEVEILSKLRHCNLVSLIGYCNHGKEMILVYEYMPNGTLQEHLHKLGTHLSWLQRLKFCIGAARGLDYLHTGTGIEFGVIHRDVKSSNILLDENWAAKISDFGLSRISPTNQPSTYVNTLIKGTFGYFDPNYFATGKLTRKSDVYSFGVVLLEVLCRKTALDKSLEWGLATWAQDSMKDGNLKNIIDSDIRGEISQKCLKEFARITNRCLDIHPKHRPTMTEVVYHLEFVLTLQEKNINLLQTAGKTIFGRLVDTFSSPVNEENSDKHNAGRPENIEMLQKPLGRRRLERRNALKSVDYDVSTSSPPVLSQSGGGDRIIEGSEVEINFICRSLGFSGPEDFAILTADWEAHKPSGTTPIQSKTPPTLNHLNECKTGEIKGARPPPVISTHLLAPSLNLNALAPVTHGNQCPQSIMDTSNDDDDKNGCSVAMPREYFFLPNGSVSFSFKNWQKGDFLGRGSFGTVYEGFNEYGFFFAVKEVSLLDQGTQGKQSISQLEQEISLLSQFKHDNIVRYLGTDKDDRKLYIFLELVPKGSLENLYQKYHLHDSQVSAYTRQILSGLIYLHDRHVVHRDIKCANILVDVSGSVKLADFGLATATKLNDIKSCKGTPYWMAPEVINNRKYKGYNGLAADIWSLGCTVLEMLTGQVPYSDLEGMQALFSIGIGEPPSIPKTLSVAARGFILECLQVNPDDRPTAAQLLKHPFLKTPVSMNSSPVSPPRHLPFI